MKIAIIGATGLVGAPLLREAIGRGHRIAALVRHPEKVPAHPQVSAAAIDAYDEASVAGQVAGRDAVISAFSPGYADPELYRHYLQGVRTIIAGVVRAGVARLLMVGGAGSLEVAPGVQLVDTPEFPAEWRPTALAAREALHILRGESPLDWTYLSPPMLLEPGERTGAYRVGGDQLLTDASGASRISLEDYAVAMLDELERPRHSRTRFTVAY